MEYADVLNVIDMINDEINRSAGNYRVGLERGLECIEQANKIGRKPVYALKALRAQVSAEANHDVVLGVQTVQFIFENPHKWFIKDLV